MSDLYRYFTFVDRGTRGLLCVRPNLRVMILLKEIIVRILTFATVLAVREVEKSAWRRFI